MPAVLPGPGAASAGSRHGLHARQHQDLVGPRPDQLTADQAQRVADHEQLGLEHAPSPPREAHVDAQPARPASRDRHRPAQQRLDQLAAGRGRTAGVELDAQRIGLSRSRCEGRAALDRAHSRPAVTQAAAPPAIAISDDPGTYSEAVSNVAPVKHRAAEEGDGERPHCHLERRDPLQASRTTAGSLVAARAGPEQ